jgi:hypothetical protein
MSDRVVVKLFDKDAAVDEIVGSMVFKMNKYIEMS